MGPTQSIYRTGSSLVRGDDHSRAAALTSRAIHIEITISIADGGRITTTWLNPDGTRVPVYPCSQSLTLSFTGSPTPCTNTAGIPVMRRPDLLELDQLLNTLLLEMWDLCF